MRALSVSVRNKKNNPTDIQVYDRKVQYFFFHIIFNFFQDKQTTKIKFIK